MWKCFTATIIVILIIVGFYTIGLKNINHTIITKTSIELSVIHTNQISAENASKLADKDTLVKKKIKQHVPKFMLDLYHQNSNGSLVRDKVAGPDIVRSVIPKSAGSKIGYSENMFDDTHMLIFNIPQSNKDEEFSSAELKLLSIVKLEDLRLEGLERLIHLYIYDEQTSKLLHIDKTHIYHKNNTWISFNITTPIQNLLKDNNKQSSLHEIFIKVKITIASCIPNHRNSFKLSLMPINEDFQHDYPILMLAYNSIKDDASNRNDSGHKNVRFKRNIFEEDYEEETNNVWDDDNQRKIAGKLKRIKNSCRKRALSIDFSEIDYDSWIVQPGGYEAFQCQGKCFYPVADHLSPTKHAIVQSLVHSVSPMKAPRSCCVPTKLDSISVLYVDNRGVLTYRYAYKDMVVLECGCR